MTDDDSHIIRERVGPTNNTELTSIKVTNFHTTNIFIAQYQYDILILNLSSLGAEPGLAVGGGTDPLQPIVHML